MPRHWRRSTPAGPPPCWTAGPTSLAASPPDPFPDASPGRGFAGRVRRRRQTLAGQGGQVAGGQPFGPGELPEAPAVARSQPPAVAGDLHHVARLGEPVEPAGVVRAQVDAAVAHVVAPLVPHRPRGAVLVLPAVG